jgi:SAM-dependent methyltransferase
MTERGVVFGQAVDAYDRLRPSYPPVAIDHVLSITSVGTAVEVGAGTGIATTGFAREGLRIVCVEPDPAMAAVLEARRLPGVEVVLSRFEDWAPKEIRVDLVFAAQAWHWIELGLGYQKALEILRPGGVIALMWNVQVERYRRFGTVYQEHAPELLAEADARILRRDSNTWRGELEDAGFADVGQFTHPWSVSRSAAEVCALYSTFSDHITLDPGRRERLLGALETHIDGMGGSVQLEYRTQVFTGRAPT